MRMIFQIFKQYSFDFMRIIVKLTQITTPQNKSKRFGLFPTVDPNKSQKQIKTGVAFPQPPFPSDEPEQMTCNKVLLLATGGRQ